MYVYPTPDVGLCGASGPSPDPPGGAPLGIYAKSQATLDSKGIFSGAVSDPLTGEILVVRDPSAVRLERFALQSVARSILPKTRLSGCLRVSVHPDGAVQVLHSSAHRSAHFGSLATCGSVWVCPVCAAKISERRRVEVQSAIAAWEAQGGTVALLTLTHGHNQGDRLADLLQAEQKALTRFFDSRDGKRLMSDLGRIGHVRSWEVTHGRLREVNNGWHPHFHLLLFLDRPCLDLSAAEARAFTIWHNACRLGGLPLPNRRYGVTIQDGKRAAAYVAKMGLEDARGWGLDSEMTKGHIKRAKDGETPFDLLRACLAGQDPQARALFREFGEAFKGKRQLVWSRGLRDRFGLSNVTDEELAAVQEEDAWLLALLSRDDWRMVLKCDARGELLELARHGKLEIVERFLNSIRSDNYA